MSSIVLSKESIFYDELIRENARLTVQHEADQLVIQNMASRIENLEIMENDYQEAEAIRKEALLMKEELDAVKTEREKAVEALTYVMGGGDACKICKKQCRFGDDCQPIWDPSKEV